MITESVKQLIIKSRIVSFSTWKGLHSEGVISIFQKADDEGRYLTDDDLEEIKTLSPQTSSSVERAKLLRENAALIVQQAREQVLATYPNITETDGELYPPERAEACWRDFWHFLRCITFGIAGNSQEFTSSEGMANMRLLYQELRVPLGAMICGLENLKISSLQFFNPNEQELIIPYFDHLINQLKQWTMDN
ncbi:MAG TPA: phycobilisome protein [Cyanobacteria bacterium UBA11149]|nr:phycobilisome protein [Cyanobacteria bacterium UBA11367]HBE57256.1 phycobilisome protein [Cyanobacteria bacterium UBA11366]HBR73633.1 phycobilisome protein [Cyanobacteria bacterium UBA11159]HBS69192.1 phycobilisome protein [Cyanobacteria bacterium UBA11153]HBW91092.1 phycobilisome protein [Cyanobacteria bacterium UBA11149]HCA96552.1 phycobilisome protein [Cyanobacteria bacterium UBA9226]